MSFWNPARFIRRSTIPGFPKEAVQNAANQMAILRKVLRRIRRYWVGLVASLLLATLYVVMSLYIPILVGNAIDCISMPDGWILPPCGGYLRNVAICAAVAALAQWLMNQINNHMTYGVYQDIGTKPSGIFRCCLSYLDKTASGRCGQPGDG